MEGFSEKEKLLRAGEKGNYRFIAV